MTSPESRCAIAGPSDLNLRSLQLANQFRTSRETRSPQASASLPGISDAESTGHGPTGGWAYRAPSIQEHSNRINRNLGTNTNLATMEQRHHLTNKEEGGLLLQSNGTTNLHQGVGSPTTVTCIWRRSIWVGCRFQRSKAEAPTLTPRWIKAAALNWRWNRTIHISASRMLQNIR